MVGLGLHLQLRVGGLNVGLKVEIVCGGKIGALIDVNIKECDSFSVVFCCEFDCGVGLVQVPDKV